MRLPVAILGALLLLALPAAAGEVVVLLPLESRGDPAAAAVGEAARDLLAGALSAPGGPRLVDRTDLDALLDEVGRRTIGGEDLGRRLGATRAVGGSVARTADGWSFVLTVISVPDGAVLATVEETGGRRDLGDTAEAAAAKVAKALAGGESPANLEGDPHTLASLHFLRGLGFLRAGLSLEAVGEFLLAGRLRVRFVETRLLMAQAYLAARDPDHASIEARAFLAAAPGHPLAGDARRVLAAAAALPPVAVKAAPEARAPVAPAAPPSDPMEANLALLEKGNAAARRRAAPEIERLFPTLEADRRDRVIARVRDLLRPGEEARAAVAFRLLSLWRPEMAEVELRRIVPDDRFSGATRAEMLNLFGQLHQARAFGARLFEVLLELLDAESVALRKAVIFRVGWHEDPVLRRRASVRAREVLLSGRFPDQAPDYASRVDWKEVPDALAVAKRLLASGRAGEREAGLVTMARIDPALATETAWGLLDDAESAVRLRALRRISQGKVSAGAFERLLAKWSRFVADSDSSPRLRTQTTAYLGALRMLLERELLSPPAFGGLSPPPTARDGPEAFLRWAAFWRDRVAALEPLAKRFEAAGEAERERLLLEMGDVGCPALIAFFGRLDPRAKQRMTEAWIRALRRYALSIGVPEDDLPPRSEENRIGYLTQQAIQRHLRHFRPWEDE